MTVGIGINGIKELLNRSKDGEIRMSMAQAREISIILDERDIVELFGKGMAVDIVIKKVGEGDILPARLQKQLSDIKKRRGDKDWLFEGFFDIKMTRDGDKHILTIFDVVKLLMEVIPGDRYKISNMLEEYDGFCRIRVIDCDKNRYLSIWEAGGLIGSMLPTGVYKFDIMSIEEHDK